MFSKKITDGMFWEIAKQFVAGNIDGYTLQALIEHAQDFSLRQWLHEMPARARQYATSQSDSKAMLALAKYSGNDQDLVDARSSIGQLESKTRATHYADLFALSSATSDLNLCDRTIATIKTTDLCDECLVYLVNVLANMSLHSLARKKASRIKNPAQQAIAHSSITWASGEAVDYEATRKCCESVTLENNDVMHTALAEAHAANNNVAAAIDTVAEKILDAAVMFDCLLTLVRKLVDNDRLDDARLVANVIPGTESYRLALAWCHIAGSSSDQSDYGLALGAWARIAEHRMQFERQVKNSQDPAQTIAETDQLVACADRHVKAALGLAYAMQSTQAVDGSRTNQAAAKKLLDILDDMPAAQAEAFTVLANNTQSVKVACRARQAIDRIPFGGKQVLAAIALASVVQEIL